MRKKSKVWWGFTLLELVVSFALFSLISFFAVSVYFAQFRLFSNQNTSIDVAGQNKIALEEVVNQIRESESVASSCTGCGIDSTSGNVLVLRLWPLDNNGQPKDPGGTNYDYIVYKKDPTTFSGQINDGRDDVNEDGNNFDYGTNTSNFWIGTGNNTGSSYTGLRFNNVNIAKGALIKSASVDVYNASEQQIQTNMIIYADNAANSQRFSSTSRPSGRIATSKKVSYSDNSLWSANRWYSLGDISGVIQEIVNRSDWNPGNSISIVTKGTGSQFARKFATSYDGSTINAAKLSVSIDTLPKLLKIVVPSSGSSRRAETDAVAIDVANLQFDYNNADPTAATEITVTVTTTASSLTKTLTTTQSAKAILRNK